MGIDDSLHRPHYVEGTLDQRSLLPCLYILKYSFHAIRNVLAENRCLIGTFSGWDRGLHRAPMC